MKGKTITLIILLCTLIIVAGGAFFLSKSQDVMTRAQSVIGEELSAVLGSPVSLGQIEITSFDSITIHDVKIADKQAEPVLESEKVVVTYHLLDILHGKPVAGAISELTVQKPTLYLAQKSGGRWNVQDLLQNDNEAKPSFKSKITITDGKALLRTADVSEVAENINGSVELAELPTVNIALQAKYKGESVKAKGSINSQGRSSVALRVSELLIADYQRFLPEGPLKLVGGSARNVELTVICDKGNFEWAGTTELAEVDIDVDKIPVRKATGSMIFNNNKIYLGAAASVFEQPVDVRGSISLDTSQPVLKLTVASTGFDPRVIVKDLPLEGKIAFKAEVTGQTTNPIITGTLNLKQGTIQGVAATNANANIYIFDNKVKINKFSMDVFGGSISATGMVEPETSGYELALKAHNIDLGNFGEFIPNCSGRGDANLKIIGTGALTNADIQGTVEIGQGKIAGVDFKTLATRFYHHAGIIDLDYVNLDIATGLVTANGKIDKQELNLTAYAKNLPLQELDKFGIKLLSGTGDVAAQIKGTITEPECNISFTAVNGQAFYQPFAQAQGNLKINKQQVVLNDLQVLDGVTAHKVQGTIDLQGQQQIHIAVNTVKARAENIIKLLVPGEKLTGNVDNYLLLTGTLKDINAEGQMSLTDGSFRGQLIKKSQGAYKRQQGITTINDFSVDSLNTEIKLAGTIAADNELKFAVTAQNMDLERLNLKIPYSLVGLAQFKGELTGSASAPLFNGQFDANTIKVNNQEINAITGQVNFDGNEVKIPALSFMQKNGKFTATGGFVIDTRQIYGNLDLENVELDSMLATFKSPDKDLHGQLNGHVRVNGIIDRPDIWLTADLKSGRIKKYVIESVKVDVLMENSIIKINELSGVQGSGVIMARGTADLNGEVDIEIGGRDIDAGLVAAMLDAKIEPKGRMGFAAQMSGPTSTPHTAISLEVTNGGMGDTTFDSLYGLLIVENKLIRVNQVLLQKGPYRASAYGVIPIKALNLDGLENGTSEDTMDLKLRLDEANLSILPLLTKKIAWAEGPTKGEINITGTLKKPNIIGRITVDNGALKLADVMSPIQKVAVDISFDGTTITVKKFDGHIGKGLYSLTGTAELLGMTVADYDFSLVLDKPEFKSKYFTGVIDGQLNFNNKNNRPKLSGKLLFENDTINIPIIPEMEASNLNIDLDVEMRLGKKVRFYNPYLYDIMAQGKVNFAGSTLDPDFTGRISAIRGTIKYLKTQFKVNEASVSFKKFAAFDPIIKLSAQTNIQKVVVDLGVNGPLSKMQFSLTSEPAMGQQELLSLLTLRSSYNDKQNNGGMGRDELVSALGAGLQMQFVSQVEGTFRSALGLDEFRVVQDTTSDIVKKKYNDSYKTTTKSQEVYNIEMSKYLTEKLLLTYTMGVSYNKSDLALRYSLTRRTSLNASIDEENRKWFGIETRFRF